MVVRVDDESGNVSTRRSWYHERQPKYFCSMTDFKTRILRLKPEVQFWVLRRLFFHRKVEDLHLKSYFLRNKETKLNANL